MKPMISENCEELMESFGVELDGRVFGDDLHVINKCRDNDIAFVFVAKGAQDERNREGKKEDRNGGSLQDSRDEHTGQGAS